MTRRFIKIAMLTKIYRITDPEKQKNEIEDAAATIRAGGIVAMPTETVYGLAANAFDARAVKKIFDAKGRPQDNPLIVHIAGTDELYRIASEVPEKALQLAERFWPGPLTVVLPKKDCIPDEVSAGLSTVAVRMPSHPAARALIRAAGVPLAAPSANISGFPSPTSAQHVTDDMNSRIDVILDGGDCDFGIESTVVTLACDPPRILRPGAVTPEQLETVLGKVEIDDAVLNPLKEGEKAASPGMKYRHYSPMADVTVVKGSLADFLIYVKKHPGAADHALCFEGEEEYIPLECVTFGKKDEPLTQAKRLFDALRELDAHGAEKVLARMPSDTGVGLGVCNRLFRAAGFKIVSAETPGRLIGICGLSGSGKSTVCRKLAQMGSEIIDTDLIAREITEKGSPVLKKLSAIFGEDIIKPDGTLDRGLLASRAFSDKEKTAALTGATHPEIIKRALKRADEARSRGLTAVIDAPLLFTAGLDRLCDLTVAVTAPAEVRAGRIHKRDGISEEETAKRFASQKDEEELIGAADIKIKNYPPFDAEAQIETLFS